MVEYGSNDGRRNLFFFVIIMIIMMNQFEKTQKEMPENYEFFRFSQTKN